MQFSCRMHPGGITDFSKRTTGGLEAGVTILPPERQSAHGGASVSAPNGGSGLQNQLDGCPNLPLNRNCQTPNLPMLVRIRGVAARHERRPPVRLPSGPTPKAVPECVVFLIDRTHLKSRPEDGRARGMASASLSVPSAPLRPLLSLSSPWRNAVMIRATEAGNTDQRPSQVGKRNAHHSAPPRLRVRFFFVATFHFTPETFLGSYRGARSFVKRRAATHPPPLSKAVPRPPRLAWVPLSRISAKIISRDPGASPVKGRSRAPKLHQIMSPRRKIYLLSPCIAPCSPCSPWLNFARLPLRPTHRRNRASFDETPLLSPAFPLHPRIFRNMNLLPIVHPPSPALRQTRINRINRKQPPTHLPKPAIRNMPATSINPNRLFPHASQRPLPGHNFHKSPLASTPNAHFPPPSQTRPFPAQTRIDRIARKPCFAPCPAPPPSSLHKSDKSGAARATFTPTKAQNPRAIL
jgi:hypothetical protein